MYNKEELLILIEALNVKFLELQKEIKLSTDVINTERRTEEQNALLTVMLKTINLSDTAE